MSQQPPPKHALLPLWKRTRGWEDPGNGIICNWRGSMGVAPGCSGSRGWFGGCWRCPACPPTPILEASLAAPLYGPAATRRRSAPPLSAAGGVAGPLMNMHEQRRWRVSRGLSAGTGVRVTEIPPGPVAPAGVPRGFGTDRQHGPGTPELSGGLRCHGDGARPWSRPTQPLDRRLRCRGNEARPRWRRTPGGRTRIPAPRRHPGPGNGPDGFQMWVVAAVPSWKARGAGSWGGWTTAGQEGARRGGEGGEGQGRGERAGPGGGTERVFPVPAAPVSHGRGGGSSVRPAGTVTPPPRPLCAPHVCPRPAADMRLLWGR